VFIRNAFSFSYVVVSMAAMVIGAAVILLRLTSVEAEAGKNVTTQEAAAAVGATILPTEPKLRVEPK
jgi:hypothetical protein